MKLPELSLCMIMKNEEHQIARCLESVRGIVDEIVIADTGSTDNSVEIARGFGAKVISVPWNNDFAAARNRALDLARCQWVLQLDADEALERESTRDLRTYLAKPVGAYWCRIRNYVGDDLSPGVTLEAVLRLFQRKFRYENRIHESVRAQLDRAGAVMADCPLTISHWGFLQSEIDRKQKGDRNLRLLLEQAKSEPNSLHVNYNLAREYMVRSDWTRALEHFSRFDPRQVEGSGEVWVRLHTAYCLIHTDRNQEACDLLTAVIATDPEYTDLYYGRALSLFALGRNAEALADLKRCLDLGDAPPPYQGQQGVGSYLTLTLAARVSVNMGRLDRALSFLSQALKHNPSFQRAIAEVIRISPDLPAADVIDFLLAHVEADWLNTWLSRAAAESPRHAELLWELQGRAGV